MSESRSIIRREAHRDPGWAGSEIIRLRAQLAEAEREHVATKAALDEAVGLMDGPEKGAHLLLCLRSAQAGPIKDPEKALRSMGFDSSVWEAVSEAWRETPEGWVQKRVEAERALATERIECARRAGKASAISRAKEEATPESNGRSTPVGSGVARHVERPLPPTLNARGNGRPTSAPTSQEPGARSQSQEPEAAAATQQQVTAREGESVPTASRAAAAGATQVGRSAPAPTAAPPPRLRLAYSDSRAAAAELREVAS